jgi:long-chain acyl-CoA synthetase
VLVSEFNRDLVLKAIDSQQPSLCVSTPSMLAELVEGPDVTKFDWSSLRVCLSCGERLPTDVADQVEELTGGKLREAYGLTEAGPFTHANPIYGMEKSGSLGLPITDTVCMVVDQREPTRPVLVGQPGELAIHGPQVMQGYLGRASDTALVLRDGWLLTGDIVVVDEDGYFHHVDQKRDVIRRGDREVSPIDVEAVLMRHPKVAKAAVAGIPDFAGGEMLKAYVVLHDDEIATSGEIDAFCRQELAPYQLPQRYEFRAFLPQTLPGKPMREALIAEELAQLGPL